MHCASCLTSFLILSACTAFVPNTLARVAMLSPLETDPSNIAVEVALPDGIGIMPGSAILTLTVVDQGVATPEAYSLAQTRRVFAFATEDADAFREQQRAISQARTKRPDDVSGAIALGVSPCRTSQGPAANSHVSVSIRLSADGPFLPLIRNGPLSAITDEAEISAFLACPT